jgi:hypothetical protein
MAVLRSGRWLRRRNFVFSHFLEVKRLRFSLAFSYAFFFVSTSGLRIREWIGMDREARRYSCDPIRTD